MNEINIDYYMGTATFFVDLEASSNGIKYRGAFKVKCILNPLEYINADNMYRELIGKNNPQFASEYISQLCYSLAQLKYRVMECPDWFKNKETGINGSHVDDNILLHVLDKSIDAEAQYREGIKKKYEQARDSVKKAIDEEKLVSPKKEETQGD